MQRHQACYARATSRLRQIIITSTLATMVLLLLLLLLLMMMMMTTTMMMITLDADDSLRLLNTTLSSLAAVNFIF